MNISFWEEQFLHHWLRLGRLHRAGAICQHCWTHLWSIVGALCTLSRGQHQKPLLFRRVAHNYCSSAYYLISSFVICLNLVQILCHSPGNSAKRARWHCESRGWGEKAASFFLTKDEREGEGETHARMLLPFHLCYHCLCQLLNRKVPFHLCSCKWKGRNMFSPFFLFVNITLILKNHLIGPRDCAMGVLRV